MDEKLIKPMYLAPMEGLTGYVFRNTYERIYGKIEKYFTPFIVPVVKREFKDRELRDILPKNNENMNTVPQILTNKSEDFLRTVNNLKNYGYKEININMGCPSGTVVAKHKGAGFLEYPERIDQFLYEIFEKTDIKISVKTRIGMESEEEFYEILEVFNKYKLEELIVHPRLRIDYYKNNIHMNMFQYAYENSKNLLCYNGDICTGEDYSNIVSKYSKINAVMIGRGLIANPCLTEEIYSNYSNVADYCMQKEKNKIKYERLFKFHNELLKGYGEEIKESNNILFKMKEMWFYFEKNFSDEKEIKKIKKAKNIEEYKISVERLFEKYM